MNLRKHLLKHHPQQYDQAIVDHQWDYKSSTQTDGFLHNAYNVRTQGVPPFSQSTFLEYLVHFIVADDQVHPINLIFFHALTHSLVDLCR